MKKSTNKLNKEGKKLRICMNCDINHYENCTSCYGFGLYEDGIPITAYSSVYKIFNHKTIICPECGSDHNGVPK